MLVLDHASAYDRRLQRIVEQHIILIVGSGHGGAESSLLDLRCGIETLHLRID